MTLIYEAHDVVASCGREIAHLLEALNGGDQSAAPVSAEPLLQVLYSERLFHVRVIACVEVIRELCLQVSSVHHDKHCRVVERRVAPELVCSTNHEPPTREEYDMLTRLHRQQEAADFDGLRARDLFAESWERVYLEQENVPQKVFGGYLMHRAFQLASIHSEKIASHRTVVVAVNRINFLRPVRIGDTLHFTSRIVYSRRTSIAVETRIERIGWERSVRDLSNNCVFTFVNVDDELRPQPVPPIFPTSYDEDARYLAAYRNQARARYKQSALSRT